jgi:hypothetical protein
MLKTVFRIDNTNTTYGLEVIEHEGQPKEHKLHAFTMVNGVVVHLDMSNATEETGIRRPGVTFRLGSDEVYTGNRFDAPTLNGRIPGQMLDPKDYSLEEGKLMPKN